jgi:predicted transcriptional regulator of viral defense system
MKKEFFMASSSLMQTIRRTIRAKRRGWVFTPKAFTGMGSRAAVDQALSRLGRKGEIRRLAHGLYEFPRVHPRIGVLSPSPDAIAEALAAKTQSHIMMSGARAANLLGLSPQVPARNIFLTNGRSRTIQVGHQQVVLQHVAPSKMLGVGTEAGLVIQALRSLGASHVGEAAVDSVSEKLPASVKAEIKRLAPGAPGWLQPTLTQLFP